MTLYLLAVFTLGLYVTICEIYPVITCMTLTLTVRRCKTSNVDIPMERPSATFYLLAMQCLAYLSPFAR